MDDKIKHYRPGVMPEDIWAVIGDLVREWVSQATHHDGHKVRRALTVTAQFTRYCWQTCGYGLDPDDLFQIDVIDEFIINGMADVTPSTRATYRADLLRIGRALRPHDAALAGSQRLQHPERVNPPYTREQQRLLLMWAHAQASPEAVLNAVVLLACGLGAGLKVGELMRLTAADVTADTHGVLLSIGGKRPRLVPVRVEWESTLADVAQAAWKPDMYLFRPSRETIHANSVYNFISRSRAKPFPISMQRLRTTWIINHLAAGVPFRAVERAAGLYDHSGIRRYLDFLEEPHPDDARRALREGRHLGGETP